MNWTIEYKENSRFLRVRLSGKFNVAEHHQKMDDIVSQEYWKPGINILFDCTNLDFSDTRYEDIRQIARDFVSHDALIGCGKIAILTKSVADFGVGRQFELLTDEKICANVSVFLNEKQVERWLES